MLELITFESKPLTDEEVVDSLKNSIKIYLKCGLPMIAKVFETYLELRKEVKKTNPGDYIMISSNGNYKIFKKNPIDNPMLKAFDIPPPEYNIGPHPVVFKI